MSQIGIEEDRSLTEKWDEEKRLQKSVERGTRTVFDL